MSYTIKFSDPTTSTFITVPDMPPGINTTDTDLSLVGRGYPNYGQKIAENFLHLLENFSNSNPPSHAIRGQLWYDNANNKLKVNTVTGGQRWSPTNGVWQQGTDPSLSTNTNVQPGDLWVDTHNNLLSLYASNGTWEQIGGTQAQYNINPSTSTTITPIAGTSTLYVSPSVIGSISRLDLCVGPAVSPETVVLSTASSGAVQLSQPLNSLAPGGVYSFYAPINPAVTTGSFPKLVSDSAGNLHWIIEHKIENVTVSIDTADSFYPNPVIPNFNSLLNTGTNMTTLGKFWGTAFSADALNLYPGALTLRVPTDRFLIKDDVAGGDIPGQGQVITGRVFFQNTDGIVLTSSDDTYGTSKGKIQIYKSNNDLILLNDRNPDYGYGNIQLNTRLGKGSVQINSSAPSVSTQTGALIVKGGVGIGGNLYVGGSIHYELFVAGSTDNIYGGAPGQLVYQISTGTTGFVSTASTGSSLLISGGNQAPYFQTTSSTRVGYSDNTNNIIGGSAGQFVVQINANQTGFVNGTNLSVATATYAGNLIGPINTFPYQIGINQTGFLTASQISVNTATNIAGGSAGYFVVQTGAGQTGFKNGNTLSVSTASNLSGGAGGSLAYQSASGVTTFLSIGTTGKYLKSNGTTPEWDSAVGLTAGQVAYGQGAGSELAGDTGMTYNYLNQTLTLSGDVVAGSDREIKDNIETITDALAKTLALRGVSFNYKKGGKASLGLIAQEVEAVIPEIVSVNDATGFLGIGYNALIGLLVEAIKEQQLQIDELKRRIG